MWGLVERVGRCWVRVCGCGATMISVRAYRNFTEWFVGKALPVTVFVTMAIRREQQYQLFLKKKEEGK